MENVLLVQKFEYFLWYKFKIKLYWQLMSFVKLNLILVGQFDEFYGIKVEVLDELRKQV